MTGRELPLTSRIDRQTVDLLQARYSVALANSDLAHLARVEVEGDLSMERALVHFRAYIAAGCPEHLPDFEVPASWWHHLKAELRASWPRLFGWLRPRFKVLQAPRTVYRKVCPHVETAHLFDRQGNIHLEFLRTELDR